MLSSRGLLNVFLAALLVLHFKGCVGEQCSTYGAVRLVGGSGSHEGNVQVCMNNTWGYVCDNSWGSSEARGVCYQLGYSSSSSYVSTKANSFFGSGDGTVHLDNLYCFSITTRLVDCSKGSITCNPYKDVAGVVCRSGGSCTNGDIRLTSNYYGRSEGRVEVCYNSNWGTVCRRPSWRTNNTRVICKQLGYSDTSTYTYTYVPFGFGSTNLPIRYKRVRCDGDESSLSDCTKTISSSGCTHSNDIGVRCQSVDDSSCISGSVRLWSAYNNTPAHEGVMQICRSSKWYAICGVLSNCHVGRIVCQQLGYSGAIITRTNAGRYYGYFDSNDDYRYNCGSTVSSLTQCSRYYRYNCGDYNDAYGVICSTEAQKPVVVVDNCTSGDVRLVDGTSKNNGRVEYCYNGVWSPMCSLSSTTSQLICKKLGYKFYKSTAIDRYETFGVSNVRSVFNWLNCYFWNNDLSQCSVSTKGGSSCYITQPNTCSIEYGLTCYEPTEFCTNGDVRLKGGILEQEGRPEVCVDGIWGSICDSGWGVVDAYIFCKTLGYEGSVPNAFYNGYFGNGPYIAWNYIACQGWETNITQCSRSSSNCYSNDAAGVRCRDKCQSGDIRLVGGDYANEGVVQVCYNSLWGQIDGSGWSNNNAKVVCRYLGYGTAEAKATPPITEFRNLSIHYSNVRCTGSEYSISECPKRINAVFTARSLLNSINSVAGVDCIHDEPVEASCIAVTNPTGSTICSDRGSLRLMNGATMATDEGRLEFCNGQYWTPLCSMSNAVASVACKQLGHTQYSWGAVLDSGSASVYGDASMNYSLVTNITCTGEETSLATGCTINDAPSSCLPYCPNSNIGIRCFSDNRICNGGDIRLVDGDIEQEGRVEVCVNGVWGSICDNGWDQTDAHVICQQLGHPVAEPRVFKNSRFGAGLYPIVYSNTDCGGWEGSIKDCNSNGYTDTTCSRNNVAGVLCGYNCSDGDVRLEDGPYPYEGTVEVCYDSLWGLVDESGWSLNDARVVCSQLGFGSKANQVTAKAGSFYGKTNKTVHFSSVVCDGTEDTLLDCDQTTYSLEQGKQRLLTSNVAGVKCAVSEGCIVPPMNGSDCTDGDVRLMGPQSTAGEGRVEYCHKGYWTSLCSLSEREALVTCHQLGHRTAQYVSVFTDGSLSDSPSSNTFTSYIDSIVCDTFKEDSLDECSIIDGCQQTCVNRPVSIKCFGAEIGVENCVEGSIRLVDGKENEGRIEICQNNVWGSVCGRGFDYADASVVCNQISGEAITRPSFFTTNSSFGGGVQPILAADLKCRGQENRLVDCQRNTFLNFSCPRQSLAGVKCKDDCKEDRVRLVGGPTQAEGVVEICYRGSWGTINAEGWNNNGAVVVCRQLGYENTGAKAFTDGRYNRSTDTVNYMEVDCSGTEISLADCGTESIALEDRDNLGRYVTVSGVDCVVEAEQPTDATTEAATTPPTSSAAPPTSSAAPPKFSTAPPEATTAPPPEIGRQSQNNNGAMIALELVVVIMGIALVVIICVLVVIYIKKRRNKPDLSIAASAAGGNSKSFSGDPIVKMSAINPIEQDYDHFETNKDDTISESPSFDEKILPL